MANKNLDTSVFDAVGIYTVEIDASTPPIQVDSQKARIIVGFSEKGPKNTLVYLRSKRDALNVFGDINVYLERRGSYFQRSLQIALETSPVFALNLLPVNNDNVVGDKVEFISYSIDSGNKNSFKNDKGTKLNHLYSSFFNKERFWKADSEYFQSIVDSNLLSQGKYFSLTNLSNKPITILTRKSSTVLRDFQLTVSEFYGKGKEPAIAKPFDYVSDYFIDVVLIEGQWDDFQALSADPIYGSYFGLQGVKKERLNAFLSSDGVTVLNKYTGSLLPDMLDNSGKNWTIDRIINKDFIKTNMLCTLNEKAIEEYDPEISTEHIDLIGHNLVSGKINKVNYLSYNEIIDNLSIVEKDTDKFEYSASGIINLTRNVIGYEIENVKETVSEDTKFKNLNITNLNLDLDLEAISFSAEDLYIDLGLNYWLYGNNNESTVTGIVTYDNNGPLLFKETDDFLTETSIKFAKSNNTYISTFVDGDLIDFNSKIVNKQWFTDLLDGDITSDIYIYQNTENPVLIKAEYTNITVTSTAISDDTKYEITIEGLTINGDLLAEGPYYIVFDPFTIKTVNVYANRKDSEIYTGMSKNTYIIAPKNIKYKEVDNLTNYVSYDGTNYRYLTTEDFIINDTGTAYKLTRETALDNTIILTDSLATEENGQGEQFSFINNEMKIDLVDNKKIYEIYDIIRLGNAPSEIVINQTVADNININDYIVGIYNNNSVLTKVVNKVKNIDESSGDVEYVISTVLPIVITDNKITKYLKIDDFISHFNLHALSGFTFNSYHLPDGTDAQMNKIYEVLDSKNSNLREILADKDIINWRYIVDTFSGGIEPNLGGKSQLSKLAQEKGQALALLNAPSIKQFSECTNPYFTDLPTALNPKPILNTKYIKDGGNLSLGPTNKFSIPDEENGGKYCGVFGPYLNISENEKLKSIPPAADISNNYMRKFKVGQPYAIVAGEPNGIIANTALVGVEYDLLQPDRAAFEKIGINPIVTRNGITQIFANLTGYQRVVSPLNSLHVRDLLISIENTLINITSKYLFRKNTETVRLEIQTIVETYLEGVLTDNGITWFNVIIDTSNNTNDIINQRMAILDVSIEPALGMEKFVNRITIYGAGGAASGGF